MSQRHGNYYGFVKTGFKNKQFYYPRNNMLYIEKNENVMPFWSPFDFEGGPKIDHFGQKSEQNVKKEVQETALKKHDSLIDF